MVVMPVQGAELPHALPSRRSAVVGAIVMQKVSIGPGAMHAGAPSTVPQRASPTRCPLCHTTKCPLARGRFLLARSSFPERGLLVSSSVATSRAAASIVLNMASAAATGWLPEVSSIQEEPLGCVWNAGPFKEQAHLAGGHGSLVKWMLFQHEDPSSWNVPGLALPPGRLQIPFD